MEIIYKYIEIYKDEISQKVIESLFPLLIKSLKYYGVYQIMCEYLDLIVNIFVFLLLSTIIKVATNTSTTENARAPLFITAVCIFLMEQFIYGTYLFLLLQTNSAICLIKLTRVLLFIISIYIYMDNHKQTRNSLSINNKPIESFQQPQIIYNIVVNNNNNIVKQVPTKIIDLSGEITEDDEFIKEKNDKKGVGEKKKNGEKRKYVRKTKEKKN
jgi:hypothetical protein